MINNRLWHLLLVTAGRQKPVSFISSLRGCLWEASPASIPAGTRTGMAGDRLEHPSHYLPLYAVIWGDIRPLQSPVESTFSHAETWWLLGSSNRFFVFRCPFFYISLLSRGHTIHTAILYCHVSVWELSWVWWQCVKSFIVLPDHSEWKKVNHISFL